MSNLPSSKIIDLREQIMKVRQSTTIIGNERKRLLNILQNKYLETKKMQNSLKQKAMKLRSMRSKQSRTTPVIRAREVQKNLPDVPTHNVIIFPDAPTHNIIIGKKSKKAKKAKKANKTKNSTKSKRKRNNKSKKCGGSRKKMDVTN